MIQGVPFLDGRPIIQVAIVVEDMDRALEKYASVWGLAPWALYEYSPDTVENMTYRGGPGSYSMLLALTGHSPQVELIQPLDGPSLYHEWLESRGPGLHHVGVYVPSIEDAIEQMGRAGYEVAQAGWPLGLDGDGGYAYFDTLDDLDLYLEAIEYPRRLGPPDRVWPKGSDARLPGTMFTEEEE